jgi:hypothetical protein
MRIVRTGRLPGCLLALAIAAGCGDDGPDPRTGDPIRFDALAVGQESRYAVLVGEGYIDANQSTFRYVDGELAVEVVGEDDAGFLVRESFVAPVDVGESEELDSLDPDEVFEYHLRVDGDALDVIHDDEEPGSRLFAQWSSTELRLDDIPGPETDIFGWKTTLDYCECYEEAFVGDGDINGAVYDRLNVVVDNQDMEVDGPGATGSTARGTAWCAPRVIPGGPRTASGWTSSRTDVARRALSAPPSYCRPG